MALHEPVVCPRVSALPSQDGYPEKVEKEGIVVCKNHMAGLNTAGLSDLEEMPERDYDGGT